MGLRIKELRKARDLSQESLAAKAGLSRSQLSEIETEAKPANTRRLEAIARALDVRVDELFTPAIANELQEQIVSVFATLSEEDRKSLLRLAEALAAQNR